MNDRIFLLIAGAICAASAALFWRIFDVYGFGIIMSVIVLTLTIDNARLRKQLREQDKPT